MWESTHELLYDFVRHSEGASNKAVIKAVFVSNLKRLVERPTKETKKSTPPHNWVKKICSIGIKTANIPF